MTIDKQGGQYPSVNRYIPIAMDGQDLPTPPYQPPPRDLTPRQPAVSSALTPPRTPHQLQWTSPQTSYPMAIRQTSPPQDACTSTTPSLRPTPRQQRPMATQTRPTINTRRGPARENRPQAEEQRQITAGGACLIMISLLLLSLGLIFPPAMFMLCLMGCMARNNRYVRMIAMIGMSLYILECFLVMTSIIMLFIIA